MTYIANISFLPEFMENVNKFEMGKKHTGENVSHLLLPPWAKGDPRRFVDINRAVSAFWHV